MCIRLRASSFLASAAVVLHLLLGCLFSNGATTIDPVNRYAYSANLGWIDFAAQGTNGAVIGDFVCSGYIYSANAGWINLGDGNPANGIRYQNAFGEDSGVNHDGFGNLRGLAWGANTGWLNFESQGAPRVDLRTGQLSGWVWSATCGWVSLSNAVAFVQTRFIDPGAMDSAGLPVPWKLSYFGITNVAADGDPDQDGMSNLAEYRAGTHPNQQHDALRITRFQGSDTAGTLIWTSVTNRFYAIEASAGPSGSWMNTGLGIISPDGPYTSRSVMLPAAPGQFYRIQVLRPLSP